MLADLCCLLFVVGWICVVGWNLSVFRMLARLSQIRGTALNWKMHPPRERSVQCTWATAAAEPVWAKLDEALSASRALVHIHTQCFGNDIYLCCGGNWMQNHCFIHAGLLFCRKEKIPNYFFSNVKECFWQKSPAALHILTMFRHSEIKQWKE